MEISHAEPYDGPLLDQLWETSSRSDSEPPEIEARPGWYEDAPALVTIHEGRPGPHAVVHTPDEAYHCDRPEAERMERQMTSWEPSRREKALIHYAAEGAYEEPAEAEGADTPLCYILGQIKKANSRRGSYTRQTRRFGSWGGHNG